MTVASNLIEEQDQFYYQAYYNNAVSKYDQPEESKLKPKYLDRPKKKHTSSSLKDVANEEVERQVQAECRKELVKLQQKAKLRKMREERERERQAELKKKQNLDALNNMLRKRKETYIHKKELEHGDKVNDSLVVDDRDCANDRTQIKKIAVQSTENFKINNSSIRNSLSKG